MNLEESVMEVNRDKMAREIARLEVPYRSADLSASRLFPAVCS